MEKVHWGAEMKKVSIGGKGKRDGTGI